MEPGIQALTERELNLFYERTARSLHLTQRAVRASMPLGVPTGVCSLNPYPIAIAHGSGAHVTDIDDNEYVDYHNGFGTTVFGHAHPAVTDAIQQQARFGTHFGALTEPVVPWAEHLCERFGLDWIRFSPSGTEATMDAIRLARARTSRTIVAKIEGGYHGSHDIALISNNLPLDGTEGSDTSPASRPASLGLSPRVQQEVVALPFNDLEAAGTALDHEDVAALIVEPILFNVGAIWPEPGYLQGLRDLCDRYGTLLIFDETKTGATVAYGGASELFGVEPHLKTLGKGIGGGLPVGALGDTDGGCFDLIESWGVPHLGTFNGNPLTAAAGLAALTQVLTPAAYAHLNNHYQYLKNGLETVIKRHELPAYVTGAGAKGCIVWSSKTLRNYRDYRRNFRFDIGHLTWLYMINRGVFLAPGQDEQWTHTVSHDHSSAGQFLRVFAELAAELPDQL